MARATDQTSERVLSWLLIGEWLTLSLLKCHMDVTMTSMNQCCRLIQSERVHSYGMGANISWILAEVWILRFKRATEEGETRVSCGIFSLNDDEPQHSKLTSSELFPAQPAHSDQTTPFIAKRTLRIQGAKILRRANLATTVGITIRDMPLADVRQVDSEQNELRHRKRFRT